MSRRLKQRILSVIKHGVLVSLTLASIAYVGAWLSKSGSIEGFIPSRNLPVVRIAVLNSVFYHGEVWYSYVYAAVMHGRCHVSLFTDVLPHSSHNENGFFYLTRSWSHSFSYRTQEHANQLLESTSRICEHQIIIMASAEGSYLQRLLRVLLNHCDQKTTYLLLVQIHVGPRSLPYLEKCLSEFPKLMGQKRVEVRFLVLAHHVKQYAEKYRNTMVSVDLWIPVFPLDLPFEREPGVYHQYFDFVIQGYLISERRNYSGLIHEVNHRASLLDRHRITFTIVGHSENHEDYRRFQLPQIRLFIAPHLIPANIYYSIIQQSAGIIPLFAQDTYFNGTQSSSISASFLTRTPLLASQRLLDTHPHVPREAVWFKHHNETDIEAILRIVRSYPSDAAFREALFTRRQHLQRRAESFYVENARTLHGYAESLTSRRNNQR